MQSKINIFRKKVFMLNYFFQNFMGIFFLAFFFEKRLKTFAYCLSIREYKFYDTSYVEALVLFKRTLQYFILEYKK